MAVTSDVTANPPRRRLQVRKGLDVAFGGEPQQTIDPAPPVSSVATLAADYPALRASLLVSEGDRVRLGQPLFIDRHAPEVRFTSPGAGVVAAIHRGARRALESVVVNLDGNDEVAFPSVQRGELGHMPAENIRDVLLTSGFWTALRSRPYGKIAAPESTPQAVFVTAIDTRPLAADPAVVIGTRREEFADGLTALARLVEAPIFLCVAPGADIAVGEVPRMTVVELAGPHPAGLVGTHIHLLEPVNAGRAVWYIGYQDVIAIGALLTTGRLPVDRVVALAGSGVQRPRLLRTRLGAAVDDLTRGELSAATTRILSGCALAGRAATGQHAFLGRYHNQVTVLAAPPSEWNASLAPVASRLIPVDSFERVLPLDVLPTPLFRALLTGDTETAATLGCLELEEEDLALCRFVCPSRLDYGLLLRSALTEIEQQG